MSLINCKVYLELSWIEGYILTSDGDSSKFEITVAKLHVPMFTTKGNIIVTKQLSDGFKDQLLEQLSNKACQGSRRRKKHMNYLMYHFKVLEDYLFLLMLLLQVRQMIVFP